ncbi:hypothetical protein BGX24_005428 [Mortierella sp. AD032]|nr:hypothetical protein BGX24_005428 [Mortierella sp. AD032]
MASAGYSLRKFILAILQSTNSEIRRYVGMFYHQNGPAAILQYLNKLLQYNKYDETFAQAAVDLLITRTRSELNKLSEQDCLRSPANSYSRRRVETFSMENIEGVFAERAPHLTRLLEGLAVSKAYRDEGIPSHVGVIGSQLLHAYSQKSNYFQMIMGLYFHTSGCPKRVLSVLAAVGLSVSHQSVMNTLAHLTEAAMQELRTAIKSQPFFILYDNINFPNRKYDQRSHNKDTFENGTTATIVLGGNLDITSPASNPIMPPNISHLIPDARNRSLAFFITLLDRKRLVLDSPNYHAADEILRHVFDGMVLRLWQVGLGTERLELFAEELGHTDLKNLIATRLESIDKHYLVNSHQLSNNLGSADVNAALFLRDMMVYMDLGDAIKAGDIGRLEEVLLLITVMFQAGGMKHYASELLRVAYGMRYAWSDLEKTAIMSSWLINTQGKPNAWMPADFFQEHNNLLIKTVHSAKGSNMSWETLANKISTNIHLFSETARRVEGEFHISHNSNFHSTVSAYSDITRITDSLRHYDILGVNPHPDNLNVPLVRDLIKEGFEKFPERFKKFMESITLGHYSEEGIDDILEQDAIAESLGREYQMAEDYISASLNH